jgi:hypothetical protein
MSRFSGNRRLVRAILDGVAEMHRLHSDRGRFDSHDLINWMNDRENAALNELIALYHGDDPVHTATVQVANFLKNEVGQRKTHEQVSRRRITLNGGTPRNGDSKVSVWEISASTREGLSRAREILLEDKQPAVPPTWGGSPRSSGHLRTNQHSPRFLPMVGSTVIEIVRLGATIREISDGYRLCEHPSGSIRAGIRRDPQSSRANPADGSRVFDHQLS